MKNHEHHIAMHKSFEKAEGKMAGKSAGSYKLDQESLKAKGGKADGKGSSDEYAEKGQRKSEKNNKTSYGSKTVGADIDGGIED